MPKSGVAGSSNCRLMPAKEADPFGKHWKHHLWYEGYGATVDTTVEAIAALWISGRHRVFGFGAEVFTAGRAAGLVEFAKSDDARVTLDTSDDLSDKSNLHIYWMFTQPAD